MPPNNQPVQPVPTPNSQIGATNNPQTAPTANKVPLSAAQIDKGYKASEQAPTKGNAPITQEGGYYQSRATDLGLMEQSPKETKLPEMNASLGTGSSPTYGTGGILNTSGFQKPDASSYQSGTSLTSTIPNIMADNNVQSAIGNVTQPVATGVMRAVPKLSPWSAPAEKMNLWDASSVLDNI